MTKSVFTDRYRLFLHLLIQERRNKNITQVQLAQMLKKPQSYVSKYENGERRLDVIEFLNIADYIGIDASDFIKKLKSDWIKKLTRKRSAFSNIYLLLTKSSHLRENSPLYFQVLNHSSPRSVYGWCQQTYDKSQNALMTETVVVELQSCSPQIPDQISERIIGRNVNRFADTIFINHSKRITKKMLSAKVSSRKASALLQLRIKVVWIKIFILKLNNSAV